MHSMHRSKPWGHAMGTAGNVCVYGEVTTENEAYMVC